MYIYVYEYICTYFHIRTHKNIYTYIYVYMHTLVYMFKCIFIYLYIHTYKHSYLHRVIPGSWQKSPQNISWRPPNASFPFPRTFRTCTSRNSRKDASIIETSSMTSTLSARHFFLFFAFQSFSKSRQVFAMPHPVSKCMCLLCINTRIRKCIHYIYIHAHMHTRTHIKTRI